MLPLFPEGSLSESVTTTVWIGVMVLALFNLRFGWTLSGLVTPGYVVPLLIVKPMAAAVIFMEAVISYLLVWYFAQRLSRRGLWSNFFGRDRFFAIVLCSIVVKVALDGYLLPAAGRYLSQVWMISFDFSNNLHSFGLIIVALIANQFWKPGLIRGLPVLFVTTGITYAIVRYPLMMLTNFSIGSLEYMYEDIATSILASPKAYIIMITTAYMASRMNLMYAWDYNGILIPSLLALQWYEPVKIVSSFAEAYFIYFCGGWILKLPALKETTVEGARKILLFFNVSFAYKMLIGHVMYWLLPGAQASDYYGFGYLLPSLIAMKMHDKNIPIRLSRTTLQTSAVGAIVACIVGFTLTTVPYLLPAGRGEEAFRGALAESDVTLGESLQQLKVQLYGQKVRGAMSLPLHGELAAFHESLQCLRAYVEDEERQHLLRAAGLLARANYRLREGVQGLVFLEEREPRRGWGLYVLSTKSKSGLVVEVPAPLEEQVLEAGAYFFQLFDGRALAVSTCVGGGDSGSAREALVIHGTPFHEFHRAFGGSNVLQVRGYTRGTARRLSGGSEELAVAEPDTMPSSLWVKAGLPAGLRLEPLKESLGGLVVEWDEPPFRNIQRTATRTGFAELYLSSADRGRLYARFLLGIERLPEGSSPEASTPAGSEASLQRWLQDVAADLAPRGSNLYVRPPIEALLFFDHEVFQPALDLAREWPVSGVAPEQLHTRLAVARAAANAFNYELVMHEDPSSGKRSLVIVERSSILPRRYWGTYIFRVGPSRPFTVEVPRPGFEENTLEYGWNLFDRLGARALFMAGSHPRCNTDGSADVVLPMNKASLFNLANQVLLRELRDEPLLVIQVRALGYKPGALLPHADALLSFGNGSLDRASLGELGRELVSCLDLERLGWRFVDGGQGTGGYEVLGSAQAHYLTHTRNKEFAALWLSPWVRMGYRSQADNLLLTRQLRSFGLEAPEEVELQSYLETRTFLRGGEIPREMLDALRHYQRTLDINALDAVRSRWPEHRMCWLLDIDSQRPFLMLRSEAGYLPIVMSLDARAAALQSGAGEGDTLVVAHPSREAVRRFVASPAAFLLIRPEA